MREDYRGEIAHLADVCSRLANSPWPALLERINAGGTIRSIHGYELDLADTHGVYDLAADGTVTATAREDP